MTTNSKKEKLKTEARLKIDTTINKAQANIPSTIAALQQLESFEFWGDMTLNSSTASLMLEHINRKGTVTDAIRAELLPVIFVDQEDDGEV